MCQIVFEMLSKSFQNLNPTYTSEIHALHICVNMLTMLIRNCKFDLTYILGFNAYLKFECKL